MKPEFARVLLKRQKFEKSAGGILIPGMAQTRLASLRCVVIALGPNCETRERIKVGDEVLIGIHAGTWVNEDGSPGVDPDKAEYFVCQEEDILLHFPKDPVLSQSKEQPSDRADRDYYAGTSWDFERNAPAKRAAAGSR